MTARSLAGPHRVISRSPLLRVTPPLPRGLTPSISNVKTLRDIDKIFACYNMINWYSRSCNKLFDSIRFNSLLCGFGLTLSSISYYEFLSALKTDLTGLREQENPFITGTACDVLRCRVGGIPLERKPSNVLLFSLR